MDFEIEIKWFEKWLGIQFSGIAPEMLARNEMGYKDDTINTMFLSFCAGWQFRDIAQ